MFILNKQQNRSLDSNIERTSSAALASFTLNDAPVFIDTLNLTKRTSDKQQIFVSAITNKGHLNLFSHDLSEPTNGNKLKKPIKAVNQIKVETKENGAPLKIYGSFVTNAQHLRVDSLDLGNETTASDFSQILSQYFLYIVYGSHLNPKIEKLVCKFAINIKPASKFFRVKSFSLFYFLVYLAIL